MKINVLKSGGYSGGGLSVDGGQLTGPLMLSRNPELPLEAATKQYIDNAINSIDAGNFSTGTLPITRLPSLSGDVTNTAGDNNIILSNTGITAGEYSKVTVDSKGRVIAVGGLIENDLPNIDFSKITTGKPTTLSGYGVTDALSTSGGLMSGALTLHADPVSNEHLVTKQFVDGLVAGLGGASTGDIVRKPYAETPSGFLKCNGAEIDKTTYSNLYAIIGDQYSSNNIPGSGQPWRQQYQINDQQSVDIGTWTTGTSLPGILCYTSAVVTKNRVYLIGGNNGTTNISTVYTAPINADGTLGTWTTTTSFPVAIYDTEVIVIKNRIYTFGGYTTNYTTSVYTAPINSDGTLGAWTASGNLPVAAEGYKAIVTKNRVYLIGGGNGLNNSTINATAPINSDGTLGTWSTYSDLPGITIQPQVIATKNRVYVLGGYNGSIHSTTVYTAPINADGTLGAWTTGISLPGHLSQAQSLVTKNRVYLLSANSSSAVYTAPINADGTLGTWTTGTSLPGTLIISQVIATKNRIYMIGGHNGTSFLSTVYTAAITGGLNDYSPYYTEDTTNYMMPGSGKPWQQQYQINTSQTSEISGWTTGTSLPGAFSHSSSIVTKNRVYLFAGLDNTTGSLATVYTAPINTDGTLGSWTTSTNLPGSISDSRAIVTKNRVYLLGGYTSSASSAVYTAPINSDGTLGAWTTGTNLPVSWYGTNTIVTKNRVYILGGAGQGGTTQSGVYTAPINTDGTLGTWTSGISLPAGLYYSSPVITKNRIYLIGGNTSEATIYTATINSDGIIGVWSTTTSLPGPLSRTQAIVTKNRIYLLGGYNNSGTWVSTVYSAPINSDGIIGTWNTISSLAYGVGQAQAIVTKNKIYLLGGTNAGGAISSVQYVTISADLNDYSPYYDGSIVPLEPVNPSTLFKLPDYSNLDINGIYHYIKY